MPPLANLSRPVRRIWFPSLIAFFSDFLFVLVSHLFRFSFYIAFLNLFEYLYSFGITFSFSSSYSNTIAF